MDFDALYPGRFLKGRALGEQPRPIRIVSVVGTSLEGEKGEKATGVLKYRAPWAIVDGAIVARPSEGEIVWCKSNAALTAMAFGGERDVEKWAGRMLSIWFDPSVMLGREQVGGIRVYGSPELKRVVHVEVKRPRRSRGDRYVLVPTDAKTGLALPGFERGSGGEREPGAEG